MSEYKDVHTHPELYRCGIAIGRGVRRELTPCLLARNILGCEGLPCPSCAYNDNLTEEYSPAKRADVVRDVMLFIVQTHIAPLPTERNKEAEAFPYLSYLPPSVNPSTLFGLWDRGRQRVESIKYIRKCTGWGLKECSTLLSQVWVDFEKRY